MSARSKPPELLDGMIEHIRYELERVLSFVGVFGNGWCSVLQPDLAKFTGQSLLEAALIHFRCLIEFLSEQPDGDTVVAREYVQDWDWTVRDNLTEVWHLHGRLAHLGKVRRDVAVEGAFRWDRWLEEQAPVVLRGMREFLARLRNDSPERYQLFTRPRGDLPAVDFVSVLDSVLEGMGEGH